TSFEQDVKLLQRWSNHFRRLQEIRDSILRLEAVARDAQDHLFIGWDLSLLDQLPRDGHRHSARRFRKDAFRAAQKGHPLSDLFVVDILRPAAGLANDLDGKVAVCRVANRQRLGDGLGFTDGPMTIGAVLDGARNWIAAGGLGTVDLTYGV